MQSNNHRTRSRQPGRAFSLIELLLVLVILTVLGALVATRFTGTTKESKIKAAKHDISTLGGALDTFEIDCGRYPTTGEGLQALIEKPANAPDWNRPYLKSDRVPKDQWGNEYHYEQPGKHRTDLYDLYSAGPDGKADTEDDITNWTKE